jgi:hypothetical protein
VRVAGIVRYVDVGCRVYSNTRHRSAAIEPEPLGGLVVAVTEKLNQETGEIDRAFLTFDDQRTRGRLQWATLLESEVDRDHIEAVDTRTLTRAWRRLAQEIAYSRNHQPRNGPATPEEVRCAEAIRDLMAVVFGPDGVLYGVLEQLAPGKPAAPRPTYPPAPASMFVD